MSIPNDPMEQIIRQFFDDNFRRLQLEVGHGLTPDVRQTALWQTLLYWRKLRSIAEKVTDTEVRLNLPEQTTPQGRKFGIEGVVDIVREGDYTVMYDIKTHTVESVRGNITEYERQLNVYAHIWQHLRGEALDEMAVIATAFPDAIQAAVATGNEAHLEHELARWEPLVEIPFDSQHLTETIRDFGQVVDQIEEGDFAPSPVERLRENLPGSNRRFATYVCRNCDVRFSCESYRQYVDTEGRSRDRDFRLYYGDDLTDIERDDWLTAALETAPTADTLARIA